MSDPVSTTASSTTPTTSSSAPEPSVNDQIVALQRQVSSLLLALVILSGIFTIFMLRQKNAVSGTFNETKQFIEAFNREKAGADAFVANLIEFAKTHPDFKPIADKYGLKPAAAPATGTQAPATTPAAAPKK